MKLDKIAPLEIKVENAENKLYSYLKQHSHEYALDKSIRQEFKRLVNELVQLAVQMGEDYAEHYTQGM